MLDMLSHGTGTLHLIMWHLTRYCYTWHLYYIVYSWLSFYWDFDICYPVIYL